MADILVIDDQPFVRDVLHRALAAVGHRVVEAVDGIEGADLFGRHPCDLVLCDLYMPRESGLTTIRKLCGRFPGAKVVAMTAGGFDGGQDVLPLAERAGAVASLRKPFPVEVFLAVVADVLRGR
jgi:CheY-like chemotaxis protein